jgi:hypothetical protein
MSHLGRQLSLEAVSDSKLNAFCTFLKPVYISIPGAVSLAADLIGNGKLDLVAGIMDMVDEFESHQACIKASKISRNRVSMCGLENSLGRK